MLNINILNISTINNNNIDQILVKYTYNNLY